MRKKKLINRRNDIHQDDSSAVLNIALEKEGEKKKIKSYYNTGYSYLVNHPSTDIAKQGLTLLSERNMLLFLWNSDSTPNASFKISKMRKGIKKRKKSLILHGWESREETIGGI